MNIIAPLTNRLINYQSEYFNIVDILENCYTFSCVRKILTKYKRIIFTSQYMYTYYAILDRDIASYKLLT